MLAFYHFFCGPPGRFDQLALSKQAYTSPFMQMLMKTTFVYGLGMDPTNVTIYVQPLAAFCLSIWNLDMTLDEFWMPEKTPKSDPINTLLSLLMVRGPLSVMTTVTTLVGKLARMFLTFPLKLAWGLIRLILSQMISLFSCALLLIGVGMLIFNPEPSSFSFNLNETGPALISVLSNLTTLISLVA